MHEKLEKLKEMYEELPAQRQKYVWIAVAVIALSLLRVVAWKTMRPHPPTAREFVKKLASGKKQDQLDAIFTAGLYRTKTALPALEKRLDTEKDDHTLNTLIWSIGRIDQAKVVSMTDGGRSDLRVRAVDALMKLDPANMEILVDKIPTTEGEVQDRIFFYVDALKDSAMQGKILQIVENANQKADVRKRCMDVLKKIGTPEISSRLMALYYGDKDAEVKRVALETVQSIEKKGK